MFLTLRVGEVFTRVKQIREEDPFDFRKFTYSKDELSHLFDDWVDHYATKYAICKSIAPLAILEIGVRYGYSAKTFFAASPDISYTGIDNCSFVADGNPKALAWAQENIGYEKATFITSDTGRLARLPGEFYDLIHVDGRRDGDGIFHDLELAFQQSEWVLLDGPFRSEHSLMATSFFLRKYRQEITDVHMFTGFTGHLLFRTNRLISEKPSGYKELCHLYEKQYFTADCGDYQNFKLTKGRSLTDLRQQTLFSLINPRAGKRILDLGSGRGEFAYASCLAGAEVVAVDYSKAALEICQQHFSHSVGDNLKLVHEDITEFYDESGFDAIVAADIIEHLEESALEALLRNCAKMLKTEGYLFIHTFPNKLVHEKNHQQRRLGLMTNGGFLPENPRNRYEDLLHINEQTSSALQELLKRFFPHVLLWTADISDQLGTLVDCGKGELNGIYALAGQSQIDKESLQKTLSQETITASDCEHINLKIKDVPLEMAENSSHQIPIEISNESKLKVSSQQPTPVKCTYQWFFHGEVAVPYGIQSAIWPPILPGMKKTIFCKIFTPPAKGKFELLVTLIQQGQFFSELSPTCQMRIEIDLV